VSVRRGAPTASLVAFVGLALLPIVLLAASWIAEAATRGPSTLALAIPRDRTLGLLGRSLLMATAVTALATALGVGLAVWMWDRRRAHRVLGVVFLIPFFVPTYIHVMAWLSAAGRHQAFDLISLGFPGLGSFVSLTYGFWPTVAILSVTLGPMAALLVRTGLEAVDAQAIETGLLVRPPWIVARRIIWPLARPAVVASSGLVFVLALMEYGVPSMFDHPVYVTEIYAAFSQDFDARHAFGLSVPLMVIGAGVLAGTQAGLRRSPSRGQTRTPPQGIVSAFPFVLRLAVELSIAVWAASLVLPILVLLARGAWPRVVASALAPAGREIALTVVVAAACAVLAAVIVLPLAAAMVSSDRAWRLGWLVCALPLAVPPPVTGIALIHLWNRPWLAWGYGGVTILVLAHAARLLPFGLYAAVSRVRQVDPRMLEAAAIPRVSRWRRFLWVGLPLHAPALVVTLIVVGVLSLGELGASLLVVPPGHATLPMRIYNLLHYGATNTVCALSLVIVLVAGAVRAGLLAIPARFGRAAR
jgi:iron(III) transport system permease protein